MPLLSVGLFQAAFNPCGNTLKMICGNSASLLLFLPLTLFLGCELPPLFLLSGFSFLVSGFCSNAFLSPPAGCRIGLRVSLWDGHLCHSGFNMGRDPDFLVSFPIRFRILPCGRLFGISPLPGLFPPCSNRFFWFVPWLGTACSHCDKLRVASPLGESPKIWATSRKGFLRLVSAVWVPWSISPAVPKA
jgi:hypothetical protein